MSPVWFECAHSTLKLWRRSTTTSCKKSYKGCMPAPWHRTCTLRSTLNSATNTSCRFSDSFIKMCHVYPITVVFTLCVNYIGDSKVYGSLRLPPQRLVTCICCYDMQEDPWYYHNWRFVFSTVPEPALSSRYSMKCMLQYKA